MSFLIFICQNSISIVRYRNALITLLHTVPSTECWTHRVYLSFQVQLLIKSRPPSSPLSLSLLHTHLTEWPRLRCCLSSSSPSYDTPRTSVVATPDDKNISNNNKFRIDSSTINYINDGVRWVSDKVLFRRTKEDARMEAGATDEAQKSPENKCIVVGNGRTTYWISSPKWINNSKRWYAFDWMNYGYW